MHVVIVGAGIAGCATALALQRKGIDSTVVERKPADEVARGAFLTLAPNGVAALRDLGADDVLDDARAMPVPGIRFRNASGRQIADLDAGEDEERYGSFAQLVRRGPLNAALRSRAEAAGVPVVHGAGVATVRPAQAHGRRSVVELDDGRDVPGDIVVGADGIWSTIRRTVAPAHPRPRYTGIVDCGGWAEVDLPDTPSQEMVFGRRAFFGYTVRARTAYWFSNVPVREEPARGELDQIDPRAWLDRVRALHADDPDDVRTVLAAASSAVGVWPLYDLRTLPTWSAGPVGLVGDAAHATNPSTGQGASLALEDAVVLARCLAELGDPSAALRSFEALRRERVGRIVAMGRRIGTRKADAGTRAWVRDRTLGTFLRMGARATATQFAYRAGEVRPLADA